jgi:hypothetical protein
MTEAEEENGIRMIIYFVTKKEKFIQVIAMINEHIIT